MTPDSDLLTRAITASALSPAAFYRDVLGHADVSTVYAIINGKRSLPNAEARIICTAIASDPATTPFFTAAADAVRHGVTNT